MKKLLSIFTAVLFASFIMTSCSGASAEASAEATADATAGTITVTVEYIVRDSDGSANPTATQQ